MKQTYIQPASKVYEIKPAAEMLLSLSSTTVTGDDIGTGDGQFTINTGRYNRDGRFHHGDDAATEMREWLEE